MSEEAKPARTAEGVQQAYAEVCRQIGDRAYRVYVLRAEIDRFFGVAMELNQEHDRIVAALAAKAAEAAP